MTLDDFGKQVPAAERLAADEAPARVAALDELVRLAGEVAPAADQRLAQRWTAILRAQVEDLVRWAGYRY